MAPSTFHLVVFTSETCLLPCVCVSWGLDVIILGPFLQMAIINGTLETWRRVLGLGGSAMRMAPRPLLAPD
jgi:hypothetical protein